MKDKFFLDTNVIVYSFEAPFEKKKEKSDNLIRTALVNPYF